MSLAINELNKIVEAANNSHSEAGIMAALTDALIEIDSPFAERFGVSIMAHAYLEYDKAMRSPAKEYELPHLLFRLNMANYKRGTRHELYQQGVNDVIYNAFMGRLLFKTNLPEEYSLECSYYAHGLRLLQLRAGIGRKLTKYIPKGALCLSFAHTQNDLNTIEKIFTETCNDYFTGHLCKDTWRHLGMTLPRPLTWHGK